MYDISLFRDDYMRFCGKIMPLITKAEEDENVFVSPLSVYALLTMLACVTEGESKTELERALSENGSVDEVTDALNDVLRQFKESNEAKFSSANAFVFDTKWSSFINADGADRLRALFGAEVFSDENVAAVINEWVAAKTDGMVTKLLDQSQRADSVLVNAVSFVSDWAEKYEPTDIDEGIFTDAQGNEMPATYLDSVEKTAVDSDFFYGFTRPYKGGEFEFMALLPKEKEWDWNDDDDISDIPPGLDELPSDIYGRLSQLYMNAKQAKVSVSFPEFTFSYGCDLKSVIQQEGVNKVFTPDADLTPIITMPQSYVDEIKHKAYIKVDRNGTKAAAVTAAFELLGCLPAYDYYVYLNRPFLFAVMHKDTGLPVFVGVVNRVGNN